MMILGAVLMLAGGVLIGVGVARMLEFNRDL